MAVSRTSASLGRTILRRAATQPRTHAWRQSARRYASTGTASAEKAKKTSDIPWMIGSVAFTVPAAVWLLGQAPEKSSHHHDSSHKAEEEPAEEEAPAEESSEGQSEDASDKDEKSSGGDEDKAEASSGDDSDSGDSKETPDTSEDEADGPSPGSPGQINYKSGMGKGPGEQQKGTREPSETKGEKDSASDTSGAKHPYLDDDEKSKKGEGLKDTQKIHGTVQSDRPLR